MEEKENVENTLKQYEKDDMNSKNNENKKKGNIFFKLFLVLLVMLVVEIIIVVIYIIDMGKTTVKAKPIIYLYPEQEEAVTVKLGNEEKLTHTYPKYENEWEVIAKPNGDLVDQKTGRNLYSLYWEGKNTATKSNLNTGFVVKGEDTISFLEEKLEILGLTEREAEEFIIYWLPRMESNKYNYIYFETIEEINENMPLEITPNPDTVIRILMEFKALEEPIEVEEQQLPATPERNGFVAIEWGGTQLK